MKSENNTCPTASVICGMSVKTMMLVSSAMEQRRTHRNRDERVVTEGQSQGSPKRKAGVTEGQRQGSPKGKGRLNSEFGLLSRCTLLRMKGATRTFCVVWRRWFSRQVMSDSCDPVDCSPPGPSFHGSLQARILKWVAISFSRESSRPRNQTQVSCIAGRFFTG